MTFTFAEVAQIIGGMLGIVFVLGGVIKYMISKIDDKAETIHSRLDRERKEMMEKFDKIPDTYVHKDSLDLHLKAISDAVNAINGRLDGLFNAIMGAKKNEGN